MTYLDMGTAVSGASHDTFTIPFDKTSIEGELVNSGGPEELKEGRKMHCQMHICMPAVCMYVT